MKNNSPAQLPLGFDAAPEPADMAAHARQWIASPEGQAALQESQETAQRMVDELREARQVDPATLHEPMQQPAACDYDPRELAGLPIGQFHCPSCGDMVLGGMEHPPRDDWADLESFVAGAR